MLLQAMVGVTVTNLHGAQTFADAFYLVFCYFESVKKSNFDISFDASWRILFMHINTITWVFQYQLVKQMITRQTSSEVLLQAKVR